MFQVFGLFKMCSTLDFYTMHYFEFVPKFRQKVLPPSSSCLSFVWEDAEMKTFVKSYPLPSFYLALIGKRS
jgi:hypothetical protein